MVLSSGGDDWQSRPMTRHAASDIIHELAHVYLGHLGENGKKWPNRRPAHLDVREFEAESVSYLVCARLGMDIASDEYLAAFVRKSPATPTISLDRVMKSVWLLEQMGRARMGLRKAASPPPT